VRRVLVVGTDPGALAGLDVPGVEIVGENGAGDLNAALRHGAAMLRADDPGVMVGALQADLPALRPADLASAVAEARGRRAFVADRQGSGTTLLLSTPGGTLGPRFGTGSARAHLRSGAIALRVAAPSLRGDVDTPDDLRHAGELGLGIRTRSLLDESCCLR